MFLYGQISKQDTDGRKALNICFEEMSGLSETERVGFKKIFSLMTEGDLHSLSDTVTNKMIVVENVTGVTRVFSGWTNPDLFPHY
ncbi:hypothetical protein GOODEAATRI_022869, partial [Goodea atripinnis]